jgi:hypothetical protein
MTIESVDYVEADIVRLTLSFRAKVDSNYLNPNNYVISSYVVSPVLARPVTVQEVIAINNFGPDALGVPPEPAIASNLVYLKTTPHSMGANYQVTYTTLFSTDGGTVTPNDPVPYQVRITKVDSILKSLPPHIDRRPKAIVRSILGAIGLQDDKIGGSKKEQFPAPVVPANTSIISIAQFTASVPPDLPPYFYYSSVGEGPLGGNEFTFWFIGWDLRPSGVFQVPFSGMPGLSSLEGWLFAINAAGDLYFRVGIDGVNPVVDTGSYTLGGASENCLSVFHGVIDVPNLSLSLYRNGNLESTVPLTGFAPSNFRVAVGGFSTNAQFPLTQGGFCGGGAIDVALDGSQIFAHYLSMVSAGGSVVPTDISGNTWNYNTEYAGITWSSNGNVNASLLKSGILTYTDQPLTWAS